MSNCGHFSKGFKKGSMSLASMGSRAVVKLQMGLP